MASASDHSVVKSIRDDFLTCHICFEVFTDSRILPCLHTYCFQCICSHIDTAKSTRCPLVCPECREPITATARTLKSNFFINGLTNVIKEKYVGVLPCTACHLRGTESTAKVKCLDCGDYLCCSCSDGHNASSLTWKHEKIPLDDIKQGTYDEKLRKLQKIKCPKHDEKDVEFYCESCSKSLCLTCVLLDHKDHKCQTISEAVGNKKSHIISLTEDLRIKLNVLTNIEKDIVSQLEHMENMDNREKLEVEKKARQDITKVNAKKKEALEKLTRTTKTAQNEYEGQLENLRVQKSLVSSCVNFSENILGKGKDEEVLMLESVVTERLIHLQKLDKRKAVAHTSSTTGFQSTQQTMVTNLENKESPTGMACKERSESLKGQDLFFARQQVSTQSDLGWKPDDFQQQPKRNLILQGSLSATCTTDVSKPDIRGMIYSTMFGLILADKHNCKIKIMNKSGNLLREISTTGFEPSAIAVAGNVIGTIGGNFLFLFKSEGSLVTKAKIAERKQPPNNIWLAGSKVLGFVVNIQGKDRLCFYNIEGKFIRYLYCRVQSPLTGLSITPSDTIVLSEWTTGKIRVIDSVGKLKVMIGDSSLRANGTCTSRNGDLFIADFAKGIILVSSPNGKLFLDYNTHSDGINNPKYVTIDENNLVYVVDIAGRICVYKVNK